MPSSSEPWRALLARHGPGLVVFARQWAASHADAEDALQDGFIRFLHARKRPEDEVAYLFTCVRSAAIDAARTRDRRRRVDERRASPEPVFVDVPAQMELAASVEAALARLPGEQREVLVMKIWGELTFSQIATALATNANTVASRYRYAIERLEAMLADEVRHG